MFTRLIIFVAAIPRANKLQKLNATKLSILTQDGRHREHYWYTRCCIRPTPPSVIHLILGMVVVENAGVEKSGADSRGGKR